jgi:hypothetical protein
MRRSFRPRAQAGWRVTAAGLGVLLRRYHVRTWVAAEQRLTVLFPSAAEKPGKMARSDGARG